MKKQINSTFLVADYLLKNKKKSYIHNMKKVCKCNNVAQRVSVLRKKGWVIDTILEKYEGNIAIYFYKLVSHSSVPKQYL